MAMSSTQKIFLIELAEKTIKTYLDTGKILKIDESEIDDFFKEKRGVFVTLHISGALRGCIGYILPYKPLYTAVIENAYNAAFNDPRFTALSKSEFEEVDIEISVLSVPEKINSYKDIIIGQHGIILKNGFYQAVFLPQVAVEQNWDIETTLAHLSIKAGGDMDLWKNKNTLFEVFEAEIIQK
ncbi:AmmeMemoRadiSam system protein A [Candidatus Dependentiae bacterium]|nr:AmmeMemoRadiSam system protein A [Candidatus Dependentiae bacterium]